MKFLAISEFLMSILLASAFNVREQRNYTLQQQFFTPVLQEKEVDYYSRITNGFDAPPDKFRYQVGLKTFYEAADERLCGGSLISNIWVLTAAHCLINGKSVSVYLGSIILDAPLQSFHNVHKRDMIPHPDFSFLTFRNDIGLINIPPARVGPSIQPVDLPPRNFQPQLGLYAYHAGWGVNSDSAQFHSPHLLYHQFKIISNDDCEKSYGRIKIYWGSLCTETSNKISSCKGDSGGALVLKGTNIQIGINSFGWGLGCETGRPDAYTRVTSYLHWIHNKTGLIV